MVYFIKAIYFLPFPFCFFRFLSHTRGCTLSTFSSLLLYSFSSRLVLVTSYLLEDGHPKIFKCHGDNGYCLSIVLCISCAQCCFKNDLRVSSLKYRFQPGLAETLILFY